MENQNLKIRATFNQCFDSSVSDINAVTQMKLLITENERTYEDQNLSAKSGLLENTFLTLPGGGGGWRVGEGGFSLPTKLSLIPP